MITALFDFSHTYCIAICAALLPFSLFMTFGTLFHLGLGHPTRRVHLSAALAWTGSALMVLHVYTWLAIGVVMVPTYVLPFFAGLFTVINAWAVGHPRSLLHLFAQIRSAGHHVGQSTVLPGRVQ